MEELKNHSNSEENGSVDSLEVRFTDFCKVRLVLLSLILGCKYFQLIFLGLI